GGFRAAAHDPALTDEAHARLRGAVRSADATARERGAGALERTCQRHRKGRKVEGTRTRPVCQRRAGPRPSHAEPAHERAVRGAAAGGAEPIAQLQDDGVGSMTHHFSAWLKSQVWTSGVSNTLPGMPCPPVGYSVYLQSFERSSAFARKREHWIST